MLLRGNISISIADLIDNMITHIVNKGLDTLVAANLEMRGIWLEQNEKYEILNDIFMPRNFKKTNHL